MEFKITRTSFWDDKKPCKEAVEKQYTQIDTRNFRTFDEFDERFGKTEGKWLSKGINHRIYKKGYIQRELPNELTGWFIEINTLDELIAFKKKYGDLIITQSLENPNILELEIYDTYRE